MKIKNQFAISDTTRKKYSEPWFENRRQLVWRAGLTKDERETLRKAVEKVLVGKVMVGNDLRRIDTLEDRKVRFMAITGVRWKDMGFDNKALVADSKSLKVTITRTGFDTKVEHKWPIFIHPDTTATLITAGQFRKQLLSLADKAQKLFNLAGITKILEEK